MSRLLRITTLWSQTAIPHAGLEQAARTKEQQQQQKKNPPKKKQKKEKKNPTTHKNKLYIFLSVSEQNWNL